MNPLFECKFIFFLYLFALLSVHGLNYGEKIACNKYTSSLRSPADDTFCEFVKKHEKTYSTIEEFMLRANILRENQVIAQKLSALDPEATFSAVHSPFGDLTPEEFKNHVLFPGKVDARTFNFVPFKGSSTINHVVSDEEDDSFDWVDQGKLTEVKNQGTLGTCWAFSAVTVVESQVAIKQNKLVDLSVEQLVECANDSNASSGESDCAEFGGWPYLGFEYIQEFGGIYKDSDFPYCSGTLDPFTGESQCFPCMPKSYDKRTCGDHSDLFCDASGTLGQGEMQLCQNPGDKELFKIKSWRKLSQDEEDLKSVLKEEGPISVALSATILQFYLGGVISLPLCSSSLGSLDHAVVLVGYGVKERYFFGSLPYWKVRNSWGKSWGEDGYFRLKRGTGMCGINLRASIADVEGV